MGLTLTPLPTSRRPGRRRTAGRPTASPRCRGRCRTRSGSRLRDSAVQVAVGDRPARPRQGGAEVAAGRRAPQPVAGAGRRPAAVEPVETRGYGLTIRAAPSRATTSPARVRIARSASARSQLDHPGAVVEAGGDVHDDVTVRRTRRVGLTGDGGAGVDDDQVALCELVGQVLEDAVADVVRKCQPRDTRHAVARHASLWGGAAAKVIALIGDSCQGRRDLGGAVATAGGPRA